jgi:hypothetical protein
LQLFSFEVEPASHSEAARRALFGENFCLRVEAAEGCEKLIEVGLSGSAANPGVGDDFPAVPAGFGGIGLDVVAALS